MSVSRPASLWYATAFVLCGVAVASAGPAITVSSVEGASGTAIGVRGRFGVRGVQGALVAADLSAPAIGGTLEVGGRRFLAVGGGLRIATLGGWRSGTASAPDAPSGGGGRWAVRPSTSRADPRGGAGGASVLGHRLVVASAVPDTALERPAWLVAVGARGRGLVWELAATGDDGGVAEATAGVRKPREVMLVTGRIGRGGRAAWRVFARSAIGRYRVDVSWERAAGTFEGLLGRPRTGWGARLVRPGAGVAYGTRADGGGAGLHVWAGTRAGEMTLRVDARAPRSGSTSGSVEIGTEVPGTTWRWRARARVRSEREALGAMTGVSVRGEGLGLSWRMRVDHATAAPAWTAVYLGGGQIRPVRLVAGQRVVALEVRWRSVTVRGFDAAPFGDATRRAGVSIGWEPLGRGAR